MLFRSESNLLVLDEPTNDLDLETLDLLQEVIADYDGTVLIVSHDRDFLDRTVTVTLGLDGSGKVDIVAGGYEDWVRQRNPPRNDRQGKRPPAVFGQAEGLTDLPMGDRAKRGGGASPPAPPLRQPDGLPPHRAGEDRRKKLSFKDQRDLDRLPAEVTRLDREIAEAEDALHDPDLYTRDPAKFAGLTKAIDTKRAEKDAAEIRWLEVAGMAEELGR